LPDEISDRDLFGDPVTKARKGRGRPAHQRTRETVNRVILGLARGWSVGEVAKSIGVDLKTLRKHYFPELGRRAAMALMMESVQLGRLNDQAAAGNVAAEKELMKALEKGRLAQLADLVAHPRREKKPKLGKKEGAKAEAAEVEGIYAPRRPPKPKQRQLLN